MEKVQITGILDQYIFEPENEETLLHKGGKFGNTFLGFKESDHSKILVKELNPDADDMGLEKARIEKEASFSKKIEGVACSLELIKQNGKEYLIREYFEGYDLKFLSKSRTYKKHLNEKFWVKVGIETAKILHRLHESEIIHCDIKPSNILLTTKTGEFNYENPQITIIDLGSAKRMQSESEKIPFSFIYSPPEMVLGLYELIGPESDLYSLSITLYELITGSAHIFNENAGVLLQMQLTQDLADDQKLRPELLQILKNACIKGDLAKPPSMYRRDEMFEIQKNALELRYSNAIEFVKELENYLKLPEPAILTKAKRFLGF